MQITPAKSTRSSGFSLMEAILSILIMGLVFSTVLIAYTQASTRAEWSGMSLAAEAMCLRQIEQFHAAKWDTETTPPVDQTTNIPSPVASVLDLPISGTNVVWATNTSTVSTVTISTNPLVNIKMITVQTVWPFGTYYSNGVYHTTYYTNTVVDYRAPDQ